MHIIYSGEFPKKIFLLDYLIKQSVDVFSQDMLPLNVERLFLPSLDNLLK